MVYRTSGYAHEGQVHTNTEGGIEFCICARCDKLSRNSKEFIVVSTEAQYIGSSCAFSDEKVVCGSCYALEQALVKNDLFSDGVTPEQEEQLKKIIKKLERVLAKKKAEEVADSIMEACTETVVDEDIVTAYDNNPFVTLHFDDGTTTYMGLFYFLNCRGYSVRGVSIRPEAYAALSPAVREEISRIVDNDGLFCNVLGS